jgi:hypothetical protein
VAGFSPQVFSQDINPAIVQTTLNPLPGVGVDSSFGIHRIVDLHHRSAGNCCGGIANQTLYRSLDFFGTTKLRALPLTVCAISNAHKNERAQTRQIGVLPPSLSDAAVVIPGVVPTLRRMWLFNGGMSSVVWDHSDLEAN